MTEQPDIMALIDAAPAGKIMEGIMEIHKSTTGRIMLVAKIGDHTYRKVMPPAAIKMLNGTGRVGGILKRVFGGGIEEGPAEPAESGPVDGVE